MCMEECLYRYVEVQLGDRPILNDDPKDPNPNDLPALLVTIWKQEYPLLIEQYAK